MTRLVIAALALLTLAGCGLDKRQRDEMCESLGLGGYDFAVQRAQRYVDPEDAEGAVRSAVERECPDQLDALPWQIP